MPKKAHKQARDDRASGAPRLADGRRTWSSVARYGGGHSGASKPAAKATAPRAGTPAASAAPPWQRRVIDKDAQPGGKPGKGKGGGKSIKAATPWTCPCCQWCNWGGEKACAWGCEQPPAPEPLGQRSGALGEANSMADAQVPAQGISSNCPSTSGDSAGDALAARVKQLEAELAGLQAAAKAAPPNRRDVFEMAAEVAKAELQQAREERRSAKTPEARRAIAERDLRDSHAKVLGLEAELAKIQKALDDHQGRLQTWTARRQTARDAILQLDAECKATAVEQPASEAPQGRLADDWRVMPVIDDEVAGLMARAAAAAVATGKSVDLAQQAAFEAALQLRAQRRQLQQTVAATAAQVEEGAAADEADAAEPELPWPADAGKGLGKGEHRYEPFPAGPLPDLAH
jgi:hypothetical protein